LRRGSLSFVRSNCVQPSCKEPRVTRWRWITQTEITRASHVNKNECAKYGAQNVNCPWRVNQRSLLEAVIELLYKIGEHAWNKRFRSGLRREFLDVCCATLF
jgi:hypothetical protein